MAQTKPRQTKQQLNAAFATNNYLPLKGSSTRIYTGSMVDVDSNGFAVPAATSTTQRIAGVLIPGQQSGIPTAYVENTGTSGDVTITVGLGVFAFDIDGSDPVTEADVMKPVYVKDEITISRTSGGSTRHIAGVLVGIQLASTTPPLQSLQAWVAIGQTSTDAVGAGGPTGPGGATGPTGPTGP